MRTPMLKKPTAASLAARLPRAPASGVTDKDGYTAITAADVDDLALLPRRFDHFAAEVRQSFEILAQQILPKLDRIEQKQNSHDHTLMLHETRLNALEQKTKRKPRKKARSR